jgi:hypothetical protein
MMIVSVATAPWHATGRERTGLPPIGIREFSHASLSDRGDQTGESLAVGRMITPPELRWQAERVQVEAERSTDIIEKRILLDLVSKLSETASALEKAEGRNGHTPKLAKLGVA